MLIHSVQMAFFVFRGLVVGMIVLGVVLAIVLVVMVIVFVMLCKFFRRHKEEKGDFGTGFTNSGRCNFATL